MVKNKVFIDNNLYFIHQLKNGDSFISYDEFERKFQSPKISFILFNSTISAIKRYEQKLSLTDNAKVKKLIDCQPPLHSILRITKGCSFTYNILNKTDTIPTGIRKWQQAGCIPFQWKMHS